MLEQRSAAAKVARLVGQLVGSTVVSTADCSVSMWSDSQWNRRTAWRRADQSVLHSAGWLAAQTVEMTAAWLVQQKAVLRDPRTVVLLAEKLVENSVGPKAHWLAGSTVVPMEHSMAAHSAPSMADWRAERKEGLMAESME